LLKSFFLGTTIAAIDEVHQKFVPGRTMELTDFVLDVLGVLTAIVIVEGVRMVRRGMEKLVSMKVARMRRRTNKDGVADIKFND
jgi:hypothetical protein